MDTIDFGYTMGYGEPMETTLGDIVPFMYTDDKQIRTALGADGEPWFVLADICAALDIANPASVARRLDDDEYATATIQTERLGAREVTVVSEAGAYEVILRSNRPEARRLRRMVTHDILPALRKHGHVELDWYHVNQANQHLIAMGQLAGIRKAYRAGNVELADERAQALQDGPIAAMREIGGTQAMTAVTATPAANSNS